MKVLNRPDTKWTCRHTCLHCEAELEVDKSDVEYRFIPGNQRDPGYEAWSACCPVCKNGFPIITTEMSKAVQMEIKRGQYE